MKIKLNTGVHKEIFLYIDKILEHSKISHKDEIKIALGEVIQNIIRHEYNNLLTGEDWIELNYEINNELIIYIRDYAKPVKNDFLNKKFFANESGHMGLNIIRKVASSFNIKPIIDGNLTEITFTIK